MHFTADNVLTLSGKFVRNVNVNVNEMKKMHIYVYKKRGSVVRKELVTGERIPVSGGVRKESGWSLGSESQ